MNYIACYKKVLPRKLKIHSIFICLMILISMLLEVASIGLIIPTMILFLENNISIDYPWIEKFVILFFYEPKKFDYALFGLTCLLSGYLIKNSFLAFFAYAEANFINKVRKFTAVSLFKFYTISNTFRFSPKTKTPGGYTRARVNCFYTKLQTH